MSDPNIGADEKDLFLAALDKATPELREAYLDGACAGDSELLSRLRKLLAAHERSRGALDVPPVDLPKTEYLLPVTETVGSEIGPFKLREQIGEGGFGVVYVAEQQEPMRRKVALKIIKPGMDTKEVIARFEAERQALALMDHPNIAKVLDAGATESGRPYFVMELVRGIAITEYCNSNRLGTRERLGLFMAVCQAIQHAHQKGVIHRDVKPSNVLVTEHDGTPLPKVIDFGVAKATNQRLTERTIYTRHQQMIGTPLYMSPEQAELSALDVDTRSDIYSLGVLLYELLTGTTPFDQRRFSEAAYDEIRRIIREEEPPKPSTRISTLGGDTGAISQQRRTDSKRLGYLLRGDLDWIVMKALEKDRSRRYGAASDFAEDVRRYLTDEPVVAGPPSAVYRLRKFVRRRRTLVATASTIAAAIIIGFSAAVVGYHNAVEAQAEAEHQRALAIRENQKTNSVLVLVKEMLGTAGASDSRPKNYTVRRMLDEYAERLVGQFAESPDVGAEVWATIAGTYRSIEEMQRATEARRHGLALARRAFQDDPIQLAHHLGHLSWDLIDGASQEVAYIDAGESEQLAREGMAIYERLGHLDWDTVDMAWVLATTVSRQQRFEDAEDLFKRALDLHGRWKGDAETSQQFFTRMNLCNCIWRSGTDRLEEAKEHGLKAVQIARHRNAQVPAALITLGLVLYDQGSMQEADRCYGEALAILSDDGGKSTPRTCLCRPRTIGAGPW